jgi:hypothetical protein
MGRRVIQNVPFDAPSNFGVPGVQPLNTGGDSGDSAGWTSAKNDEANRAAVKARVDAAYQQYLQEIMQLPAGVRPAQAARGAGLGPDRKDFNQYASLNPEGAAQEMDTWERAMGVPQPSDPNAQADQFRVGTMAAPSDGAQIPYYTNLPVGQEDARAQDLQPFAAGIGDTSGISGPEPTQAVDPRMREVAMRARQAREMIALVPKSADVVAQDTARRLPMYIADIKAFGPEGAKEKAFKSIESGDLADATFKRMNVEATDEITRQEGAAFAKLRAKYFDLAREGGVLYTEKIIDQDLQDARGGNPAHLMKIANELRQFGKTKRELDVEVIDPTSGQYLPMTEADVSAFRGGTTAPLIGGKTDKAAPPTIDNPHDGATALADSAARADQNIQELMGVVQGPDIAGTAARAPASYIGPTSMQDMVGGDPMRDLFRRGQGFAAPSGGSSDLTPAERRKLAIKLRRRDTSRP